MSDTDKTKEELIEDLNRLRALLAGSVREGARAGGDSMMGYGGEEEWQIMMDMLGDFLFIVDIRGRVIRTNPVTVQKLGYSMEELLAMNIFDLYPPERRSEAEESYSQIIVGEKYLCDIPFRSKSGADIAIETKVTPGKWRGAEVIFSISRDVSAGKAVEYELRVAFEKMKSILSSVSAYIWSGIIDSGGRFTYIYRSPALVDITGRLQDHFQGGFDEWFGIIHEDDRERVTALYRRLLARQADRGDDTYKIYNAGGDIRWVRDSIVARPFGDNQVRLDGVVSDVTERRRAVEALEESESRLKGILSSMNELVFAFDTDMRFIFYHTPDLNKLYRKPEEFIGKLHSEVMPPEQNALFRAAFETTRTKGEAEFEYWLAIGGGDRCYSAKLSPIIKEGQFDGVVALVRDITDQKRLQDALFRSERRYRELFNNIHDGSTWIDMNGRLIDFNQPFEELLGYERDELYLKTVWDITPEQWHDLEKGIIEKQLVERGYSEPYRKEYIRKDGTVIPVEVRKYLIRDDEGRPEGTWVIVNRIIT
ncbi:MAG TPA: PAS domain S-box protein [Spirochaetota bacterium]|nr:PAS domain S-box protein [Spirochaetota bacterium]HPV42685.1 PAS domain S-box protein [Spirochaetota bacterium]